MVLALNEKSTSTWLATAWYVGKRKLKCSKCFVGKVIIVEHLWSDCSGRELQAGNLRGWIGLECQSQ